MNEINWRFPLSRIHTGIPAGNGKTAVLLWGEGACLNVTLGRSDFWDHRGGMTFSGKHNRKNITDILFREDKQAMDALFETDTFGIPGKPRNPSLLPVGRLTLNFGNGAKLVSGTLDLRSGIIRIMYEKNRIMLTLSFCLSMESDTMLILPDPMDSVLPELQVIPAWKWVGETLQKWSFEPPEEFADTEKHIYGFVQNCPEDPSLCVTAVWRERRLLVALERGEDAKTAVSNAECAVEREFESGIFSRIEKTSKWWHSFWDHVPEVHLPDEETEEIYFFNLYRFGCMTNPSGCPAGLQGAWIEDNRMPPWSADYHFNINAQMIYYPAFKANCLSHIKPLFEMLWNNREVFRHNAEMYAGVKDGYLLPHATDDRGTCMGRYWSGNVDPACGGWMAQMMFEYVRYSLDVDFLKEKAFPFMKGVMRVYEQLLVRENGVYSMPVGVSPEWNANYIVPHSWGKNPSFQLACIHRLCMDLLKASEMLHETPSPVWSDIHQNLPQFSTVDDFGNEIISIWENQKFNSSHRHHSHLAAIFPFETVDIFSEKYYSIIQYSILHWIARGTGCWAGWSYPWAAVINTRYGNGDTAEMMLRIWKRFFNNEGRGSLHDCYCSGFSFNSIFFQKNAAGFQRKESTDPVQEKDFFLSRAPESEIMQIDGAMGAVSAVMEMLMHTRNGVLHVFPAIPLSWRDLSFRKMLCEGGFLVSAVYKDGAVSEIEIMAQHTGTLLLANPWDQKAVCNTGSTSHTLSGKILSISLKSGETANIHPAVPDL